MTTPFSVCEAYLHHVGQALADREREPIGRMYVATGPVVVWDDCCPGQLTVGHDRIYRSLTFPLEATGGSGVEACFTGDIVLPVVITLLRCVPVLDAQGRPPTSEKLAAAHQRVMDDAAVVWNALATGAPVDGWETSSLAQTPVTGEGGCVGNEWRLFVGVDQGTWCVC